MQRGQFAEQLAQFEVEVKGRRHGRLKQRRETGAVAIERAQPHQLFELDAAHGVETEAAASDLDDKFFAAGLDLADEVAHHLAQDG